MSGGDGRAVVLLHGLGGFAEEVTHPLKRIASHHRLIAIDRPGYGSSSPRSADRMGPDEQANWLADVLDRLDARRSILVAHSFSASIVLWVAARFPSRIGGLVLVAPFCRPTRPEARLLLRAAGKPRAGGALRWLLAHLGPLAADRHLSALFAPNDVPRHMRSLPLSRAVQPDAILAMAAELLAFNAAMTRLSPMLPTITVPVISIVGDVDRWRSHGEWVASRLPNSVAVNARRVGHMIHHVRPDVVCAAVDLMAAVGRR